MLLSRLLAIAAVLIVAACGGASPGTATPSGATPPPGSSPTATAQSTPEPGEDLDADGLTAALAALQSLDSWRFAGAYYIAGLDAGVRTTVTGTERTTPDVAIDANHAQPDGSTTRYIRIGDDIWTTLGTDDFYHYDAADSENLIEQYEPSYIEALVDDMAGHTRTEYEPVGSETVNGIATTHFQASQGDREDLVQLYDELSFDQWAADIWLANDGGYIVKLAWGPQTVETAQVTVGFTYEVAEVNCDCPIEPPDNVVSP